MLHGAILRSPLAHARILSVDAAAAEAHPKVKAVITGETLAARNLAWMPTLSRDVQAVLATDKVQVPGPGGRVRRRGGPVLGAGRPGADQRRVRAAAAGDRRRARPRPRRAGDPRRHPWQGGQPHLRLVVRRQGGDRRGLRRRRRRGHPGHALPARPPGPAGDLRGGGRHGPGQRQADHLGHLAGPARAPHAVLAGSLACPSTRSGSSPRTSAAASATRCRCTRVMSARSSGRWSPADRSSGWRTGRRT